MAAQETQEVVTAITQMLNPRTSENYTPIEAQRILRADFKRRVKQAKYLQQYRRKDSA